MSAAMKPDAILPKGEGRALISQLQVLSAFPHSLAEDLALFCQHYLLLGKRAMGWGTCSLLPGLRSLINVYQFQHFVSV